MSEQQTMTFERTIDLECQPDEPLNICVGPSDKTRSAVDIQIIFPCTPGYLVLSEIRIASFHKIAQFFREVSREIATGYEPPTERESLRLLTRVFEQHRDAIEERDHDLYIDVCQAVGAVP